MQEVIMEMLFNGVWKQGGPGLTSGAPSGSITSDEPEGRRVYIFGWLGGDGPAVWRSEGGVEMAGRMLRAVPAAGLEKLADLTEGSFELERIRRGRSLRVRFRVVG